MNIEIICNNKFICGEAPMWNPRSNELYWADSDGKNIRAYSEKKQDWVEYTENFHASSLALHADGGIVFGSNTGFYYLGKDKKIKEISTCFDGKPILNINDIIADKVGRIYGGQECYNPQEKYQTGYLYRVDIDGSVSIIEEGLHISNGMGFSPDNSLFYLVDTILRNIYVYDFDAQAGAISNKRVFTTLPKNDGLPDGLTVDNQGYVWVARFLGSGITRYSPDGKVHEKIDLPCAQPTSLTFGGSDYNHLYITSASAYWETDLAPEGHDYKKNRGGELYRIIQNIQGKREYLARITNKT